jgi:hypothetical protein
MLFPLYPQANGCKGKSSPLVRVLDKGSSTGSAEYPVIRQGIQIGIFEDIHV